jgi:hypothetical protein
MSLVPVTVRQISPTFLFWAASAGLSSVVQIAFAHLKRRIRRLDFLPGFCV